jgi:putative addiction module component (TIGR02574 family)
MTLSEILESSVEERIKIIGEIWDSIEQEAESPPLTDAQRVDLELRLREHRANPQSGISWEEAKARLLGRK